MTAKPPEALHAQKFGPKTLKPANLAHRLYAKLKSNSETKIQKNYRWQSQFRGNFGDIRLRRSGTHIKNKAGARTCTGSFHEANTSITASICF